MIVKLLLVWMIFTNEVRAAFINEDRDSSDENGENFVVSPVSTAFLANSPVLSTHKKVKPPLRLDAFSPELIISIGEYLEFPHAVFSQLNRGFRGIFKVITPSKMIANQMGFLEVQNWPKSDDLKYLTTLDRSFFDDDEKFLTLIIDLALLKTLPNIKGPLLRLLYNRLKTIDIERRMLLTPIHPFKGSYSSISALVVSFFQLKDYEYVFDVLGRYPEIVLEDSKLFFNDEFIEASAKMDKLDVLYEVYSRNPFITLQQKFDFICKCLAKTFNLGILNLFLSEAYRVTEYWGDNYSETFLNSWIYAFTNAEERGISLNFDLQLIVEGIKDGNIHLSIRKQTLFLLLAIRTESRNLENIRRLIDAFITNFDFNNFKAFYEEILWALVVEEDYENFFYLLTNFDRIDSSKLRLAIAKSTSDDFITYLLDNFNVNSLFSNNFYGEAVHNKRLFLFLTHNTSEEVYLQNSLLDVDLFKYAVEHFTDLEDWEMFFGMRSNWSAVSFAKMMEYLLNNHRKLFVFELMVRMLRDGTLRIATWAHPPVQLNIEAAEFLLKNTNLHYLLTHLSIFMQFNCDPSVMSHLIVTNCCCQDGRLLKLLKFSTNDVLIQLPHWLDHERYKRVFNLNRRSYLMQLKQAMMDLKKLNSVAGDQLKLDQVLLQVFNPILSKLKWDSPIDYLFLLPHSVLTKTITSDSNYMRVVLDWAIKNGVVDRLAHVTKGRCVKVKGPVDVLKLNQILQEHKIRLTIE